MAAAVINRVWRESSPEAVEADLAAIWRTVAGAGPTVARAVMSNLVVFRLHEPRGESSNPALEERDAALEAVIGLHPSRTIVIEHERGHHTAKAPSGAAVCVTVFGAPTAPYGVERIIVRSASADVSLPSIVRRFVHGDRPTSIWWTEDLSRTVPSRAVISIARQLIFDSSGWIDIEAGFRSVVSLAADAGTDLADLNWRRLDPLRRALVHAAAGVDICGGAPRVTIQHRPGEGALAWLLAGWLAARLPLSRANWPSIEERQTGEWISLSVDCGADTLTGALNDSRAIVTRRAAPPIVLPAPPLTYAEAIAAELRMLAKDSALTAALAALGTRDVR